MASTSVTGAFCCLNAPFLPAFQELRDFWSIVGSQLSCSAAAPLLVVNPEGLMQGQELSLSTEHRIASRSTSNQHAAGQREGLINKQVCFLLQLTWGPHAFKGLTSCENETAAQVLPWQADVDQMPQGNMSNAYPGCLWRHCVSCTSSAACQLQLEGKLADL